VGDKMIGGFAAVAYPAKYGVSGVMTFLVSHEGTVYEKNLGENTSVERRKCVALTRMPAGRRLIKYPVKIQL
jgi:hypothetical protein